MRALAIICLLGGALGCDPGTGASSDGGTSGSAACTLGGPIPTTTNESFEGFRNWTSFDLGSDAGGDGLGDVGDRIVYLNKLPPHGSAIFPLGTIMVKTAGAGRDAGPTFAMVKRGDDPANGTACYNANGAVGWEWFEVTPTSGGASIVWGGPTPPIGDVYGGVSANSCNLCHASSSDNDFVPSAQLSLGNF